MPFSVESDPSEVWQHRVKSGFYKLTPDVRGEAITFPAAIAPLSVASRSRQPTSSQQNSQAESSRERRSRSNMASHPSRQRTRHAVRVSYVWAGWLAEDGQDRSHIPRLSVKMFRKQNTQQQQTKKNKKQTTNAAYT